MWRRDPDGKLGRIFIVRLDDTEVPALFATRDYWDFTKMPVKDVKGEFLRRLQTLEPIRPRRKVAKGKKTGPAPELATPPPSSSPGISMNVSGTGHRIYQAGGDIHETHYHTPKPPKVVLQRRSDEVSNAQASEIRQMLREWGTELWESIKRKAGKTQSMMHQEVQERFKRRLKIPRYDALEANRFDEAVAYIRTEKAKLRPKFAKTQPSKARNSLYASIKQAMKSIGHTATSYYPLLARRLKLDTFNSLTELTVKDLERVARMARGDTRK